LFNALGRCFEAVLGLFLTWYTVEKIHTEGWGLWSLVAVFTGYASLLDFGVSSGFTKYVAEHEARGERLAVSRVVSTGFFFYLGLGGLIVLVGFPFIDQLLAWALAFAAQGEQALYARENIEDMRFLFRGALILFVVNNCIAPFTSISLGLQRMGTTNLLSGAATIVKAAATFYFLENGHGVRGLLYTNAVATLFFGAGSVVIAHRLFPGLRLSPLHVHRSTFRSLFTFGWQTQVAKLSNLISFQTDRVIVAAATRGDMALVGLYGLGEFLAVKMRQIPGLLVTALVPAASGLDARKDHVRLQMLYLRSTKYIAAVSVPLTLFVLCTAELLLAAWLGEREGMDFAAWVLRVLTIGYLANVLPGAGVSIVLGMGRVEVPMYAGIISTVVNISGTIACWYAFGLYGIPLGTMLGFFVSTTWFFFHVRKLTGIAPLRLYREAMALPLLASVPMSLVCLVVSMLAVGALPQLVLIALVGVMAGSFGLVYGVLVLRFGFLDAFDLGFLENTLRLGRLPWAMAILRRLSGNS